MLSKKVPLQSCIFLFSYQHNPWIPILVSHEIEGGFPTPFGGPHDAYPIPFY
jgi:hypothetical protein